jgi:glycosyltransferase involved in cell wall biosynthesis
LGNNVLILRIKWLLMKVIGMLSVFNDEDIIQEVIEDLLSQGLELVVLDNGSTDDTFKICENFQGRGILQLKQFKTKNYIYNWNLLLRMLYDMALRESPDWVLRIDSDEFFESAIPKKNLKESIEQVDSEGFNIIQFDRFDFFMTDNDNESAKSTKEKFPYYSWHGDYLYRAWKYHPGITIGYAGGHYPIYPEGYSYKIYPKKFAMRHYKFRSKEQAEKKMTSTIRGTHYEKNQVSAGVNNKPKEDLKKGLGKYHNHILKQDYTRKIDHKLLAKYDENGNWDYTIKHHPFVEEIPLRREEIFTEDGRLKIKQKSAWELHMELQELQEHLRKGKLFATLYFLRNKLREKFKT